MPVTLSVRAALRPRGFPVLETRRPEHRAWEERAADADPVILDVPGTGPADRRREVTSASLPFVSFRYTCTFPADGPVVAPDSTLRFRGRDEAGSSLLSHGYRVPGAREAPDRPGREFVFVAERTA